MQIILATHNQGKNEEVKYIFTDLKDVEIISLDEVGITDDVEEDGKTIEENALKKANYIASKTSQWVMADDTGIYIKALGGKPGAYPARWGGKDLKGRDKMNFVLRQMKNIPESKRNACFKTAVALISPHKEKWYFEGRINGIIVKKIIGTPDNFLPYDTLFQPEGYNITFSQMLENEKNKISHRAQAFIKTKEFLKNHIK